jgi:hypothetical protein
MTTPSLQTTTRARGNSALKEMHDVPEAPISPDGVPFRIERQINEAHIALGHGLVQQMKNAYVIQRDIR